MPPQKKHGIVEIDWERAEAARKVALLRWVRTGGTDVHRGLEKAVGLVFRRAMSMAADFCLLPDAMAKNYSIESVKELVARHESDLIIHGIVEVGEAGTVSLAVLYWSKKEGTNKLIEKGLIRDLADMLMKIIRRLLGSLDMEVDDEFRRALESGHPSRGEILLLFGQILVDPPEEPILQAIDFLLTDEEQFAFPMLIKAELSLETDLEYAEELFLKALDRDPYNADVYVTTANMISRNFAHRNREALDVLMDVFEFSPANGEAHHLAGLLLAALAHPLDALDHLEVAANLLSGCPEVLSDLATVLWKEFDELEKAETLYNKAIELMPDEAAYMVNLAGVLADLGEMENALEIAEKASDLSAPDRLLDENAAAEDFERVQSRFVSTSFLWAEIAHQAEDDEAALVALERVLETDPAHPKARLLKRTIERKR